MEQLNRMKNFRRSTKFNKNHRSTPGAHSVRIWSNDELKKFSKLFGGDVVNLSGWEDKDKEGGFYRDYFPKATSYTITNYTPSHSEHTADEIHLDLTAPLPKKLKKKFDVVLSHTNLEHILDAFTAFANHCALSRDIVIIIVPFIQQQHETSEYKDYWRYTPSGLRELFKMNGLTTIYESCYDKPHEVNYLFFVGSRHPEKWRKSVPKYKELYLIGNWVS
jgi:hypothetical protein